MRFEIDVTKWARLFFLAVAAGIAIGIGGVVFLSLDNKVIGALMFTVGLYAVCTQGLNLYTGKIGYFISDDGPSLFDLIIIWIGNFAGTFITATGVLNARISGIAEAARAACGPRLSDGFLSLFILGIFCGLLMFVAVDGYKETKNPIILFMGVGTFILCGFEHCVADMFYFSLARLLSADVLLRLIVITLGNSIGGLLIPFFKKTFTIEVVQRRSYRRKAKKDAETMSVDEIIENLNEE